MMRIHGCVLLVIWIWGLAPAPFAWAAASRITLEQLNGKNQGRFYGLKWEGSGKPCSISQANAGQAHEWVPTQSTACERVAAYLERYQAELKKEVIQGDIPARRGLMIGVIKSGDLVLAADLMTAPLCDVTLTRCREPKLNASAELGKLIRTVITRELGRLPETRRRN